jgi:DNA-binding winged helix-turn-helix (wHTH) protein
MISRCVKFGDFELDFDAFQLRRQGSAVKMESLPLRLLMLLIERNGQLVSRDEIATALWGEGVFVDAEQGINTAVRKIRLALQDAPEEPRFLQTVVGKGYRFLASEVVEVRGPGHTTEIKKGEGPMITLEELGQAILAAAGLEDLSRVS